MEKWIKIETGLPDSYIMAPARYGDIRGGFVTIYSEQDFSNFKMSMGGCVQISTSDSIKGVIRGLHYQDDPCCQAKLVGCIKGKVLDVIVDLRKDSPTYKKGIGVELTPENKKELYVPRGFAHGYISLSDDAKFLYAIDNHYKTSHEAGITWDDPELDIKWVIDDENVKLNEHASIREALTAFGIDEPILSEKDLKNKTVSEAQPDFYMHKRYLVTGCKGQLGYDLVRELNDMGISDILALDVDDMDITDREFVRKIIMEYKPEFVVHCAAYTQVDKAEENPELARLINYNGTKNIADACEEIGAELAYVSTDYVFDGTIGENEWYYSTDTPNPVSVYGKTKLEGELAALRNPKTYITRTSGVFGINGKNFIKTMRTLAKQHKQIRVVKDQIVTPTYSKHLARAIISLLGTGKYGIYHATNEDYCSWFECAQYSTKDLDVEIIPVTTEEYYAPLSDEERKKIAQRPMVSKLNNEGLPYKFPSIYVAIDEYITELKEKEKEEEEKAKQLIKI